ncbi:cyclin-dependent protein kinase inhibitor SMR3-like [Rutidosis leptorrhynchoides]|uniref:cyclin-dependent protein kinase inhibitor SMR3-like n=1 Tax=Rutidosis leptorrhynchoides TaxID=125765 RepID=UPI003A99E2F5
MSTDLQLRHDLLPIRLASLKIKVPETQISESLSEDSCTLQLDEDDETCHTPTSSKNRIPSIVICPGAPKKPKQSVSGCKRKVSEFDFVEFLAREEIDMFFRSSFELINQKNKRRCSNSSNNL